MADLKGSLGAALGRLRLLFSLPFPLTVITLCGVAFVVMKIAYLPEFEFWARLPKRAFDYAGANAWAAIALSLFLVAALPLAWLDFRQRDARLFKAAREWVVAAIILAVTFRLRDVWPYDDGSRWRILVYGMLLFAGWNGVIEASLTTLKIIATRRGRRSRPVQPPA